ncbi:hypothetical protein SH449x_001722 [Pirellulaceae bacterium SH449]
MSEDTDVMFRIGVMDHPESKSALQSLASSVEAAQARMTAGVDSIGRTASRVSGLVDSLSSNLDRLNSSSGSMRSAVPDSVQPMGSGIRGGVPDSVIAQVAAFDASISKVQDRLSNLDTSGLSKSVKGFFTEIESLSANTGQVITQQWEQQLTGIVTSFSTSMEKLSESSAAAMRGRSSVPDSVRPMGEGVASAVPDAVVQQAQVAEDAIDSVQAKVNSFDTTTLSKGMQHVFSQLEVDSESTVDEIVEQLNKSVSELATSAAAQATVLKEAYAGSMVAHSEAYAAMAKDLDGYIAKNGSTMDQIAANLRIGEGHLQRYRDAADKATADAGKKFVEAGLNAAQVAKGLATIGLVSEENAEKMLRSLVVIQGTFDVVKGGIKAYTDLSDGLKKAREAQQLLSRAQTTQAALETAQLARLKAYHASLVQEAAAANTAAAANGRLAASRVAAGAAAGASAAGGAGSMLGNLAGMTGLRGIASMAGRVTPLAVAAAAGTAVYQHQTGTATTSDSSMQAMTMRLGAYLARLTGQFERLDSPMSRFARGLSDVNDRVFSMIPGGDVLRAAVPPLHLMGDIAGLAASQAGVDRGQLSLDRNRINNEADRATARAEAETQRQLARMRYADSSDSIRRQSALTTERFSFQDGAGDRDFEREALRDRMRLRTETDEGILGSAMLGQLSASSMRMRSRPNENQEMLGGEAATYSLAVQEYSKAKQELDRALSFAGTSEEDLAAAMKEAQHYQNEVVRSLEKQAQLARAYGTDRLAIEREIQSTIMAGIDQQGAKLDALEGRRKSAMRSFVDMDAIERDMATRALGKAQAGGGASLSKMERDLLSRVGTDETSRFVDESVASDAKRLGFDTTFGSSMDMTRKQLESTRQQLEAQLQASFDVSMKVEADTDRVVDAILPEVERAITEMSESVERKLRIELQDVKMEISTQRSKDWAAAKRG